MRLNPVYFKRHPRSPQNENKVPFKMEHPLELQNKYTGRQTNQLDNTCLFEMMLLYGCWKENDFNNNVCKKFITQLQTCYDKLIKTLKEQKIQRGRDVPTHDTKIFTNKQLNYLLRKYPTV